MSWTSVALLGSPRGGNLGAERSPRRQPLSRGRSPQSPAGSRALLRRRPRWAAPRAGQAECSPRNLQGTVRGDIPLFAGGRGGRAPTLGIPSGPVLPGAWSPARPKPRSPRGSMKATREMLPRVAAEPLRAWTGTPIAELLSALLCLRRNRVALRELITKNCPTKQPRTPPKQTNKQSKIKKKHHRNREIPKLIKKHPSVK